MYFPCFVDSYDIWKRLSAVLVARTYTSCKMAFLLLFHCEHVVTFAGVVAFACLCCGFSICVFLLCACVSDIVSLARLGHVGVHVGVREQPHLKVFITRPNYKVSVFCTFSKGDCKSLNRVMSEL